MTEAQKRATAAWKARHKPEASRVAGARGHSSEHRRSGNHSRHQPRTRYILKAVEKALGNPQPSGEDRLAGGIEAKLDELLKAGKCIPVDIPVDTKPKTPTTGLCWAPTVQGERKNEEDEKAEVEGEVLHYRHLHFVVKVDR